MIDGQVLRPDIDPCDQSGSFYSDTQRIDVALFGLKKPKEALPYLQKAADQNYFAAQALLFQFLQKLEDKEE